MPGSPPNRSNGGMNSANFQVPQQSGYSQRQAQPTQRMLQHQLQMQQQQLRVQNYQRQQVQSKSSKAGSHQSNPLAPAPSPLARPTSLTSSKSKGSSAGMPKPTTLGRGSSSSFIPPPAPLKAATSSMGSMAQHANASGTMPTQEQMNQQLLAKCDWKDKTIWVARQLLGGNATNGFLRATASVQRIKRQRARQTAQSKQKAALKDGGDPAAALKDGTKDASKDKDGSGFGRKREAPDQESEEILKKDVMNPRTAKKIKAELQAGLTWCVALQNNIRSILFEIDPTIAHHTPLPLIQGGEIPTMKEILESKTKQTPVAAPGQAIPSTLTANVMPSPHSSLAKANSPSFAKNSTDISPSSLSTQQVKQQRRGSDKAGGGSKNPYGGPQASPGGESGSTLRKHRKKKLPPCTEPVIELSEFEHSGKKYSRKEHFFRIFECTRFRSLKVGDFVAARVSSRDLWILARVQKDCPGFTMAPVDFLKLSEARRDAQFRDKVVIKDVEDKEGGVTKVPRNLVLPLPRTFSEAADWGHRSVKKSRVYAMYPNTTSLYSATVVDNTTFCRGDDDILVVEFDGDEADASGVLPKYHIPARFVTLIPREFPAAQTNSKKRKSTTQAQILPNAANDLASPASVKSVKSEASLGLDDGLGGMVNSMGMDDLVATDSLEDFGFDFSEGF